MFKEDKIGKAAFVLFKYPSFLWRRRIFGSMITNEPLHAVRMLNNSKSSLISKHSTDSTFTFTVVFLTENAFKHRKLGQVSFTRLVIRMNRSAFRAFQNRFDSSILN